MPSIEHVFPADLAAARGHFPGNPIVPGALLLNEALRAIGEGLHAPLPPCRITFAKFIYPVRPGERVSIEFSEPADGAIRFTCAVAGRIVLRGEVKCGVTSTAA